MARTVNIREIERFYYKEARLLDARQFMQWIKLCSEDIEYIMPNRSNPEPERAQEGTEAYHSVERELSGEKAEESPLRAENYFSLLLRADRLLKRNSWSENPPAHTRRMITNIELLDVRDESKDSSKADGLFCSTASNFLLHYSRGQAQYSYVGQRRDILSGCEMNDGEHQLQILKREVILDWNVIVAPTVALLF